jgi:hypothetical protein
MNLRQRASRQDQAAIRRACEGRDGALDLAGIAYVDWAHLHPKRRRQSLDCGELARSGGQGGIAKDGHSRQARRNLFEQFQPFRARGVFEQDETGGVAPWPRQAFDEAGADRIWDMHEHDRHAAARL